MHYSLKLHLSESGEECWHGNACGLMQGVGRHGFPLELQALMYGGLVSFEFGEEISLNRLTETNRTPIHKFQDIGGTGHKIGPLSPNQVIAPCAHLVGYPPRESHNVAGITVGGIGSVESAASHIRLDHDNKLGKSGDNPVSL